MLLYTVLYTIGLRENVHGGTVIHCDKLTNVQLDGMTELGLKYTAINNTHTQTTTLRRDGTQIHFMILFDSIWYSQQKFESVLRTVRVWLLVLTMPSTYVIMYSRADNRSVGHGVILGHAGHGSAEW